MNPVVLRRLIDFVAIVAIAAILLGLAWSIQPREVSGGASRSAAAVDQSQIPELQLRLPLGQMGIELSRDELSGDSSVALERLEQKCRDVLAESDSCVLSLVVSDEERRLLDSIAGVSPLLPESSRGETRRAIYPLTQPFGRVGVVEFDSSQGGTAPAVRRVLCWGFVLSRGSDSQTVWFASPRDKLPKVEPHLPRPLPMNQHEGHPR